MHNILDEFKFKVDWLILFDLFSHNMAKFIDSKPRRLCQVDLRSYKGSKYKVSFKRGHLFSFSAVFFFCIGFAICYEKKNSLENIAIKFN